jgi:hypothetical protein
VPKNCLSILLACGLAGVVSAQIVTIKTTTIIDGKG